MTVTITHGIATAWRRQGWLFEQKVTLAKDRYSKKIDLISKIFNLVDKRIVATRHYAEALRSNDLDIIRIERKMYREIVDEWNVKIPSLTIEMKSAFGATTGYSFDLYFPPEFSELDRKMGDWRRSIELNRLSSEDRHQYVENSLYHINLAARNFSSDLQLNVEKDREYLEQKPAIKLENKDELTHIYLIKALFKSRTDFNGV